MKNKMLTVLGVSFGLAFVISACSGDHLNANPTSDEGVIPQSSESQESSSSIEKADPSSSSKKVESSSSFDFPMSSGGDYNPAACCPDTVYIEDGKQRFHYSAKGTCPPPSIMTVSCNAPVRVIRDSVNAAVEDQSKKTSISIENCLEASDLLKVGTDSLKTAWLMDNGKNSPKVMFFKKDYCSVIDADLAFERLGDTLSVKLEEIHQATACTCTSRHWVVLPDTVKNFSYFRFEDKTFEVR